MRWLRIAHIVALTIAPAPILAQQRQTPAIEDLLDRATDYVVRFVETLSNVVAEERYVQQVPVAARNGGSIARRETRSDFLLVRATANERWAQFRDVREVDGRRVSDRADRIVDLMGGTSDEIERGRRLAGESARYNIAIRRTFNLPLLALGFLQPTESPRFRYEIEGADPLMGSDVWIVAFRERARPTVVRDTDGRDVPTSGRLWISSRTGRIWRTEWRVDFSITMTALITTEFESDAEFPVLVPRRMRERYLSNGREALSGDAQYRRWRRFEVGTQESLRE
jgi:hypothetical protein